MPIDLQALQPVLNAVATSLAILTSLIGLMRLGRHRGILALTTAAALALGASVMVIYVPAILSTDDTTRVMRANQLAWAGLGLSFLSWLAAVLVVLLVRRVTSVSPLWIGGLGIGVVLYPVALFLSGILLYVLTLVIPLVVGAVGPVVRKKGGV